MNIYTTFFKAVPILVFLFTSWSFASDSLSATDNDSDLTTTTSAAEIHTTSPQTTHTSARKMIVVRETPDTVFILNRSSLRHLIRNWKKNIGILRKKSIGISGTSTFGAYAFSVAPVIQLINQDSYLSNKHFHFSRFEYEPFLTSGGTGFIGLGNGFRLGASGMTGQRNFSSRPFGNDSILQLGVQISYGGFLVEKAVVKDRWNITAGGTIGGGTLRVSVSEKNNASWFSETDSDLNGIDADFHMGSNSAEAGFFLFEPHCGISYTLFDFFHIGLNASLPTCFSVENFNVATDDFLTVNPGFYFKLIFGNLG